MRIPPRRSALVLAQWVMAVAVLVLQAPAALSAQRSFPTAQDAVDALIAANREDRVDELERILGPGGAKLVRSGDAVADRQGREQFLAAYNEAHRIDAEGPSTAILIVGRDEWPLPIPLVHSQHGWRFDTPRGEREILDRRIGRNELSVIEVCRAYVEAQREYAAIRVAAGAPAAYAQHFQSHPGSRDGLYWEATADDTPSPLGPLIAQAQASGYSTDRPLGRREPYHGYFFRILTRQGEHAPGGPKNFVVDGRMSEGFALIAYPAVYGDSGIMTFMVGPEGIVFERNLGPQTASIAPRIDAFDPDKSWHIP